MPNYLIKAFVAQYLRWQFLYHVLTVSFQIKGLPCSPQFGRIRNSDHCHSMFVYSFSKTRLSTFYTSNHKQCFKYMRCWCILSIKGVPCSRKKTSMYPCRKVYGLLICQSRYAKCLTKLFAERTNHVIFFSQSRDHTYLISVHKIFKQPCLLVIQI